MNETEVKKYIKKHLSDLITKEKLLLHKRVLILPCKEPLLRAIYFERSGYNKEEIICQWFVQPLFRRDNSPTFSIGNRFGGWHTVRESNEGYVFLNIQNDIESIALPVLKKLSSIRSVVDYIIDNNLVNEYRNEETLAYCGVWLNDQKITNKYLEIVENWSRSSAEFIPKWSLKASADAKRLHELFLKNPAAAKKLLEENVRYTLSHLKLPKGLWPEYEK